MKTYAKPVQYWEDNQMKYRVVDRPLNYSEIVRWPNGEKTKERIEWRYEPHYVTLRGNERQIVLAFPLINGYINGLTVQVPLTDLQIETEAP